MILNVAAALAFALGVTALTGYLTLMGRTPFAGERERHLRLMKDRDAIPPRTAAVTVADVAALPAGAMLAEASGLERRGVRFEGYVQRLLRSPDGDLHLDLVAAAPVDERLPYVTAEITPAFQTGAWTHDRLAFALRPWRGVALHPWHRPPRRARFHGWLLHDFQHAAPAAVAGRIEPRVSAWEIHPVTAIEVWDEDAGAWEALPR